ncbi:hypothetical protein ABTY63_13890, partial [Streptomyces solisilvae]
FHRHALYEKFSGRAQQPVPASLVPPQGAHHHATAEICVDVAARIVTCEAAGVGAAPFRLDDDARDRLVAGLTQLEVTLRAADRIAAFERARAPWLHISA